MEYSGATKDTDCHTHICVYAIALIFDDGAMFAGWANVKVKFVWITITINSRNNDDDEDDDDEYGIESNGRTRNRTFRLGEWLIQQKKKIQIEWKTVSQVVHLHSNRHDKQNLLSLSFFRSPASSMP